MDILSLSCQVDRPQQARVNPSNRWMMRMSTLTMMTMRVQVEKSDGEGRRVANARDRTAQAASVVSQKQEQNRKTASKDRIDGKAPGSAIK